MAAFLSLKRAAICAAFLFSGSAFAGYAQLAPPAEWSVGNKFNVPKGLAVNDGAFWTRANISVGGRGVSVPARMRFAANAPRVAAGLLFRNPGARLLPGVGAWLTLAGVAAWVWDEVSGKWVTSSEDYEVSTGYEWCGNVPFNSGCSTYFLSSAAAVAATLESALTTFDYLTNGDCVVSGLTVDCRWGSSSRMQVTIKEVPARPSDCPAGWFVSPAGECFQYPEYLPLSEQDFLDGLEGTPLPDLVPGELPGDYPVEIPEISPMWVPSGSPVQNPNADPNYDPQVNPEGAPYLQPGTRIQPANDPDSPWQVDVRPEDKPLTTPDPILNPIEGVPGEPMAPGVPVPDVPGLCDAYPNIAACAPLGVPAPVDPLPDQVVQLEVQPDEGWGPSAGVCPQPVAFEVFGREFGFSWEPMCTFATNVRPVVIALAWFSVALGFFGWGRRED